jgi:hypothetical protein
LFDLDPQGEEDEGANIDLDAQRQGKCAVIKTSTRQVTLFFTNQYSIFFLDLFLTCYRSRRTGRYETS